jgi:serine/threonine protein kinase
MGKQLEGTVIADRYEVRTHLATGGMATVFAAWDRRVDRPVAIKALRALDKTDQSTVDRFRREARAAASLVHPNAVTIYDFVEEQDEYYLVMEFIDGPNLKELLKQRGRLPYTEAVEFASQICSVLQVAHSRGFIHRDIKPQNILIAPGGQAKLTDFGIVRVMEAVGLTNSGIVLGTADYLAPEQARGGELTPASDLYSLGVVLYEMLCGHPPFSGPTAVSVAMQHARMAPPPLAPQVPDLPAAVEEVVFTALKKSPERRFHSALAMQRALQASLQWPLDKADLGAGTTQFAFPEEAEDWMDPATVAGQSAVAGRATPEPRKRPWLGPILLALVAGVVIVLLGVALWLALAHHSAPGSRPRVSFTPQIARTHTPAPAPSPTATLAPTPTPTPTELDNLVAQLATERQQLSGPGTALLSAEMGQLGTLALDTQATGNSADVAAVQKLADTVSMTAARLEIAARLSFRLAADIVSTSQQLRLQVSHLTP